MDALALGGEPARGGCCSGQDIDYRACAWYVSSYRLSPWQCVAMERALTTPLSSKMKSEKEQDETEVARDLRVMLLDSKQGSTSSA